MGERAEMTAQQDAMDAYCDRHGHTWDGGGKFCLNCGTIISEKPCQYPRPEAVRAMDPAPVPAGTVDADDGQTVNKATNPKDAIGATKLPISWVPTAVNRYAALAFAEGALKYGRYNWRIAGVRASIYLDAMHRHLEKFQEGEWADGDMLGPDEAGNPQGTQVPHLASIIACAGILLDAWECDKLTDDRPPPNVAAGADLDSRVAHVAHLKRLFAAYSPHQNTIADVKGAA